MDNHERRTQIADDLRKLGDAIKLNAELPVHDFGALDIMYCVIDGDRDEREARFNAHAEDMQQIAVEMGFGFTYTSNADNTHHRATLTMPHGHVTYRVTWIDREDNKDT